MAVGDYLSVLSHGLLVTDAAGPACDYPDEGDVRLGISYADGSMTGTLVTASCDYPDESDVRLGVEYGFGTLTGTLGAGGDPDPDPEGYSPADVLRHLLAGLGLGTLPSAAGDWPIHTAAKPDAPDNLMVTVDTTGFKDGRSQISGESFEHYGVQILIRGADHNTAFRKARAVETALDESIRMTSVTIGSVTYKVSNASRLGPALALGREVPASKRHLFSINVKMAIRCEH